MYVPGETSFHRRKGTKRIARLHYRIACVRSVALQKATSSIVAKTKPPETRPSVAVVEYLYVAGMIKNHHLAKGIADVSMGEARGQLAYKCPWYGAKLIPADRFFPSPKRYSLCAALNSGLKHSERTFECPECGAGLDRDMNAALNLLQVAVGSTETQNARGRGHETHSIERVDLNEARTRT